MKKPIIILFIVEGFLFAFVPVDESERHRIFGVIQTIYSYDIQNRTNEFSSGKTSVGIDGEINSMFGYRFILALNAKTFNYTAFDLYGKIFTPVGEIRIGQFKIPFAMERLIPFPKRDFVNNSIVTGMVQSRDMGIGFYSKKPKLVEYNFALINGRGTNTPEIDKYKDVIIRIVFKPLGILKLGGALYYGKTETDGLLEVYAKERYNLQMELKKGNFTLRAEYVLFKDMEITGDVFYAQAGYGFTLNRPYLEKIEPMVRYEGYDPDKERKENALTRITLGLNLYIKGYNMRVQLNYMKDKWETGEERSMLYAGTQFMF